MENTIHLISDLRRAGSTLLSAILRQDPSLLRSDDRSGVFAVYSAEGSHEPVQRVERVLDAVGRRTAAGTITTACYHPYE